MLFFWFVSKTPSLNKEELFLWRREKGHVLALRPALILACLFFFCKVSLLDSLCECPHDRKIKGPLQRSLSFKPPFPKITKAEGRTESHAGWKPEPNQKPQEWDICRWMEPKENTAASLSFNRRRNRGPETFPYSIALSQALSLAPDFYILPTGRRAPLTITRACLEIRIYHTPLMGPFWCLWDILTWWSTMQFMNMQSNAPLLTQTASPSCASCIGEEKKPWPLRIIHWSFLPLTPTFERRFTH